MIRFENTRRAWTLRDRDFRELIAKLGAAENLEAADRMIAAAFTYIWLATQAGETRRAQAWTIELGTAVDAHPVVGAPR